MGVIGQHHVALLLLLIATAVPVTQGLKCYTCGYTAGGDSTCITSPATVTASVAITDCHQGENVCCTITKQDYKETEEMVSFSRGCQPNCEDMNDFKETEDWDHIVYQTFCGTPLCNTGLGEKPLKPGGGGDGDDGIIIGIPGENSGHAMGAGKCVLVTLILMALNMIGNHE
ncbi:unnamed protein product [Meganyctiphanes norvegica]|uniref:UPAR/Ly6 domain-containing protein n=1 Tax=Meganyctiphanes norvegica TaxID=48144 RepID=A0AAV2PV59_MEGNR